MALDPLSIGFGAGLGGLKHLFVDKPKANRANKMRAAEIELSPWTGMTPAQWTQHQEALLFEPMIQGAYAGAQFGEENPGAFGGGEEESPWMMF